MPNTEVTVQAESEKCPTTTDKVVSTTQLGFGWIENNPILENKKLVSQSLVKEKFSEGFLDSLFSNRRNTEEARFIQNIIDIDSDLIFIKDRHQRFAMVNSAVAQVYGANREELINKRDSDFNSDTKELQHFAEIDNEVLSTGKEKIIGAETVTCADGTKRTYHTIKVPILNSNGVATHLLGISTDVTAQFEMMMFKKFLSSTSDPIGRLLAICNEGGDRLVTSSNNFDDSKRYTPARKGILIVDDDEAVREVTTEILNDAGYDVYTANDGYIGFERFLEYADMIRLVILDIAMPRVDGEELFRQIRKVAPSVPVVICSGVLESSVLKSITPDEFLAKPYDPRLLLKVVTRLCRVSE
jgi:PAS domain S-box-containing protein